jgi:hypothetical protein
MGERRIKILAIMAATTVVAGCVQDSVSPQAAGAEQQSKSGWMSDPATGCKVWASRPGADDSVSWNGRCKDGFADGQGILLSYSKRALVGGYEGNIRDGKFAGRGVMWWASGNRYEGDYLDGLPHGHGVYASSDQRYEGEWAGGRRSGQGTLTLLVGVRYDGQWRDNKPNGRGVLTGPTLCLEGEWQDGKLTSPVTVSFADGGRYQGTPLSSGSGSGSMIWPDGTRYVGTFRNGKPDGQGAVTWADGISYTGAFRDGKILGNVGPAANMPLKIGKSYRF